MGTERVEFLNLSAEVAEALGMRWEPQPPCVVCGTKRQAMECRPGSYLGPVVPCRACTGPSPIPVLVAPMRQDVPRGGAA